MSENAQCYEKKNRNNENRNQDPEKWRTTVNKREIVSIQRIEESQNIVASWFDNEIARQP